MRGLTDEFAFALTPRDRTKPAYRQMCAALRAAILDGRLRPGVRLPSTRDLARHYAVARGTVVTAFEQMKAEGYLVGRTGSGTYVTAVLPDALLQAGPRSRAPHKTVVRRARRLSDLAKGTRGFPPASLQPARAFRANQPAVDLFPTTLWAQIAGRRLRRAPAALLRGCDSMGFPPLRQALADYLGVSRGVRCDREQIAIVSGVQEAIDLVGRLVLNPGDRVCMEDPGYVGAALAFSALGATVSYLPLDAEGMTLPRARDRSARLAYLTPAHQFPVGTTMSLTRRLALLEWARTSGALIFEDDYDSEFRFSGPPVPALQGLDRHGSVVFAGSFSKVLCPALRIGYLVVPPDLVERLGAVKSLANRYAPVLDQAVLCDFIADGHFGRHLRRMREIYAGRLSALLRAAQAHLAQVLEISAVEAGLQTSAWFRIPADAVDVCAAASTRGLEVVPLSRYSSRPLKRDGLLLGFAAVDATEIARGVQELEVVFSQLRVRPSPRS